MEDRLVYLSLVKSPEDNERCVILAESIRSFTGETSDAPVWLFTPRPDDLPKDALDSLNVKVFGIDPGEGVPRYLFGSQVFACAQAEKMARDKYNSLVWIDPSCLIVKYPELYYLGDQADVALRPVHIRNIGSPISDKPNGYWQTIIETVGADGISSTVTSFVDNQTIRSYFNTHSFAVNPRKDLMARWLELFRMLVENKEFQDSYCSDDLHQIFLFQALLSALLATSLDEKRIRILPPDYNYPYNLHGRVPDDCRANSLNDLTSFTYEGRSICPSNVTDIEISEPLLSWLSDRCAGDK